jgi:hypothetical protein
MIKLPNLDDLQGKLDATITKAGIREYVEYATYLPKDAPTPDDATHVLSLRSVKTGGKVEIAIKTSGGMVEMIANLGLDLL